LLPPLCGAAEAESRNSYLRFTVLENLSPGDRPSLGRVKTGIVKRISRSLLEKYPSLFTADYEKNKQLVNRMVASDSKKLKDQIAGYITHLVRLQSQKTGKE